MTIFIELEENTKGRDFIIGDVHGAYNLLDQAMAHVDFNPEVDRLISVGDLIDRGSESHRCLEFLNKPWFHAIRGNHEDLFMDMCSSDGELDNLKAKFNIQNGMGWVIDLTSQERSELHKAFSKLPIAMEITTSRGSVGLVHADVPKDMNWQDFIQNLNNQDDETTHIALWGRDRIGSELEDGVNGIDRLFFGHTPQANGSKRLGNCYYIDTGAVFSVINNNESCFMTMSDIEAMTVALSTPNLITSKNRGIITAKPANPKQPFGKYNKFQ